MFVLLPLARDMCHGNQRASPFYHDLSLLPKLSSDLHERNVGESFAQSRQQLSALARDLCHSKQRVSPFYHDLGLDLVVLIENFWIVEQLLPLVVEQLLNPILSSSLFQGNLWRRTR